MVRNRKTLNGKRILITRPKKQSKEIFNEIKSFGGEPLLFPTIETKTLFNETEFSKFLNNLSKGKIDYVVFLSVNGVKSLFSNARKFSSVVVLVKALKSSIIVVAGEKTAAYVLQLGVPANVIPEIFGINGLIREFLTRGVYGKVIYVIRTVSSSDGFRKELERMCAVVYEYYVYETVVPKNLPIHKIVKRLSENEIWAIIFTSPSAVRNFLILMERFLDRWRLITKLNQTVIAAIGLTTKTELKSNGIRVDVVPLKYTSRDLVDSLVQYAGYSKKLVRFD
jgi:uroporphyrinogen-III synthase